MIFRQLSGGAEAKVLADSNVSEMIRLYEEDERLELRDRNEEITERLAERWAKEVRTILEERTAKDVDNSDPGANCSIDTKAE